MQQVRLSDLFIFTLAVDFFVLSRLQVHRLGGATVPTRFVSCQETDCKIKDLVSVFYPVRNYINSMQFSFHVPGDY